MRSQRPRTGNGRANSRSARSRGAGVSEEMERGGEGDPMGGALGGAVTGRRAPHLQCLSPRDARQVCEEGVRRWVMGSEVRTGLLPSR